VVLAIAVKVLGAALWCSAAPAWVCLGLFFVPDFFLLYQLIVPSSQQLCPVFTRFETSRREIWLTIDDGPDPDDTPRILDLLDRHQARATFFVIGERAARHPHLVADILRRGHEVGHHTHTHPAFTFWCAGPGRTRAELDDGLFALRAAGAQPRWFRAPVGIKNFFLNTALNARGLRCVGWSMRSLDSVSADPAKVVARVMARVSPGSIVLMHEGPKLAPAVRMHALEGLLSALTARGLACVLPDPGQLR
jgi:peptidoglycan/xylan/chitin deacetylase (PgdA/CDA1 family)